jgi:hypothetical protein
VRFIIRSIQLLGASIAWILFLIYIAAVFILVAFYTILFMRDQ